MAKRRGWGLALTGVIGAIVVLPSSPGMGETVTFGNDYSLICDIHEGDERKFADDPERFLDAFAIAQT